MQQATQQSRSSQQYVREDGGPSATTAMTTGDLPNAVNQPFRQEVARTATLGSAAIQQRPETFGKLWKQDDLTSIEHELLTQELNEGTLPSAAAMVEWRMQTGEAFASYAAVFTHHTVALWFPRRRCTKPW
jgi:hypothetical protein